MKRTALYNMVEQQIRPWDVHNFALLDTLHQLPRADFLPESLRPFAYMDIELPLVIDGKDTRTKLMPPRLLARMVQELDLQGTENVALIGLGDGYLAALLAKFARMVTAYEINEDILRTKKSEPRPCAQRQLRAGQRPESHRRKIRRGGVSRQRDTPDTGTAEQNLSRWPNAGRSWRTICCHHERIDGDAHRRAILVAKNPV